MKKRKYCCERFEDSVRHKEISHAKGSDETEWYIEGGSHIYFCPYCGQLIKGIGWGEYDTKHKEKRTKNSSRSHIAPRQFSFVKFNFKRIPKSYHSKYPFTAKKQYIFLSEIPNMKGHCIVLDKESGRFFVGYHTENFIELSEDKT